MNVFSGSSRWDPHAGTGLTDLSNFDPMYNGLIEYNPETADTTDIRGDLAESWTVSSDGLTWTFKLVDNGLWSDLKPVTADDVVFSLDRMTEPDRTTRATFIKPFYKSSQVIDELTLQIETKLDSPFFVSFLALPYMKIVPKHVVEAGVDINVPANAVTSGPFTLTDLKKDVSTEYLRNPTYFKAGFPRIDGMRHFIIGDVARVFAAFKGGQLDMCATPFCNLPILDALKVAGDSEGELVALRIEGVGARAFLMNTNVAPFDDARVRRAMHLVMHRQPIIEILSKGAYPLGGPLRPNFWYTRTEAELEKLPGYRQTADGKKHPDDIAEAKRLLAEAGVPDGFKLTIKSYTPGNNVENTQLWAEQLRNFLGWDVSIETGGFGAIFGAYAKQDYVMGIIGNSLLVPDSPLDIFNGLYSPTGTRNYTKWTQPRLTEIFEELKTVTDRPVAAALAREAEDILMNDTYLVMNFWETHIWLVNTRVKGFFAPNTLFGNMKHEHQWIVD